MENDILFKVRMAVRSSVKFILKNKKLYVSVDSEEIKDMKSDCSDREFEKMKSVKDK